MDQTPVNTKDLEAQLRGMILGNVTMGGGQTQHDSQQGQHRGRGRGRGGFHRGSGPHPRGNLAHHSNARGSQSYGMNMASPSTRGGRPDGNPNGMGPRHSNVYTQHREDAPLTQTSQRPQGGFNQRGQMSRGGGPHQYPRPAYAQNGYQQRPRLDSTAQVQFMESIIDHELPKVQMSESELAKHSAFRNGLEYVLQQAFAKDGGEDLKDISDIALVAFGSLGSGFGLPGSDMDLAVVPQWRDPARADETDIGPRIPRLLEKAVLDAKMGGRLLTRTRVPILKVCETPTAALFTALSDERTKWEELSEEEKYPRTSPPTDPTVPLPTFDETETAKTLRDVEQRKIANSRRTSSGAAGDVHPTVGASTSTSTTENTATVASIPKEEQITDPKVTANDATSAAAPTAQENQSRREKQWHREKVLGPLDFPKTGVGIQCDINFANPLGIHNTHMLRCYSLTDSRVKPMVLFVKSWAKQRKINSSYSGTLSSYGWVLMVLHYLVNVASPPVCPNLQHSLPQETETASLSRQFKDAKKISGYDVRFWRNEEEIIRAAREGRLTQNRQPLAALLCGFFQYFASQGGYQGRQNNFYWTQEVLSLRTPGGILSKQEKGWVSATTIVTAEKKVTNRYLFAIEDPFEIDHNVARTVTHRGIVTVRDEFRRAGRILGAVGRGMVPEGGLFDELVEEAPTSTTDVEQPIEQRVTKAVAQDEPQTSVEVL